MKFSLKKQFLHFALPSIAAMWVFSLYTMVDGFFVSMYVGNVALSAVNLSMPFVNTVFSLAIIFGVGTSTTVGILLGQKKEKKASQVFSLTTASLLFFSLVLLLLSFFNLDFLANILGASAETYDSVVSYLGIILFYIPFFMISYHLEVLVKVDGFPRLATLGVVASALTNIILDYVFVGLFSMGIKGAAIATGIAQVLSTILFLFHFFRGKSQLNFVKFPFNFLLFTKILPLGLGDFLSEFSLGFTVFLYNRFLLITLGAQSIISYTVLSYVNLLVAMTMTGLTQGMQPLMSFYYGKQEKNTCRKLFNYSLISIAMLSLCALVLSNIFAPKVVALFIRGDNLLISSTVLALRKYSLSFIFLGMNLLLIGFFTSIGRAREAIILSFSRGFLFIYLSLQVSASLFPTNIWLCSFFAEGISLVLAVYILHTLRKVKSL